MDSHEFWERIHASDDYEYLGAKKGNTPAEDVVLIGMHRSGSKFEITIDGIMSHSWEEIDGILKGTRAPRVMTHITRIVGYYSQLHNWNKSKIAELRDRGRGDYGVPGHLADDHAGETPASKRSREGKRA